MLKGLLGELACLRAFWAAGQSPQQSEPGASLSAPTSAGNTERCVGSQEPRDWTIVLLFFWFFVPLPRPRFCPFLYPSFHFILRLSVDTAAVSLFEDATYLSPTCSWAGPHQVLLSFPWPSLSKSRAAQHWPPARASRVSWTPLL